MAWSPPAHNAGIVWVSAPGDYATFNSNHTPDGTTQINGRVVENTLQQYVLFLIGTLSLSVNLAPEQLPIIAAATTVFVLARIAFWIGYRIDPLYRAFGMAATLYLNLAQLGFSLWKILF
jgi:MAPEG family